MKGYYFIAALFLIGAAFIAPPSVGLGLMITAVVLFTIGVAVVIVEARRERRSSR